MSRDEIYDLSATIFKYFNIVLDCDDKNYNNNRKLSVHVFPINCH